jgi:hypothetical protein
MNNNFNMEMSNKIIEEKKEDKADVVVCIASNELVDKHVALWDYIFEIELNIDNKIVIKNLVRRLLLLLNDEIIINNISFELFSIHNLNRAYMKCFKIIGNLITYVSFLVTDFNYENNVKQNLKRIIVGVNEFLTWMIETYIPEDRLSGSTLEKFKKVHKALRGKRGKEAIGIMIKNLDTVINTLKQFAK